MPDFIQLEVNSAPLTDLLLQLGRRVSDASPAMQEIAEILMRHTHQAFAEEGFPVPWLDLADSTKASREAKGTWPGKILTVDGDLQSRVTPAHGADFAQVGSNLEYAAIQQLGGQAGRNHSVTIPARPYLPFVDGQLTQGAQDDILDFLASYLQEP